MLSYFILFEKAIIVSNTMLLVLNYEIYPNIMKCCLIVFINAFIRCGSRYINKRYHTVKSLTQILRIVRFLTLFTSLHTLSHVLSEIHEQHFDTNSLFIYAFRFLLDFMLFSLTIAYITISVIMWSSMTLHCVANIVYGIDLFTMSINMHNRVNNIDISELLVTGIRDGIRTLMLTIFYNNDDENTNIRHQYFTSAEIEQFSTLHFKNNDPLIFINAECSICQEEFNDREMTRKLTCNHIFHPHCIDKWLMTCSKKCPVCRVTLHANNTSENENNTSENENNTSESDTPIHNFNNLIQEFLNSQNRLNHSIITNYNTINLDDSD